MKSFNDKSMVKVIFRGRIIEAWIGSIYASYKEGLVTAKKYGWEPISNSIEEYIERDRLNGGSKFWTVQRPCVISGDVDHYEHVRAEWAGAVMLEDGEEVMIDNEVVTVKVIGDYSDPIHFV